MLPQTDSCPCSDPHPEEPSGLSVCCPPARRGTAGPRTAVTLQLGHGKLAMSYVHQRASEGLERGTRRGRAGQSAGRSRRPQYTGTGTLGEPQHLVTPATPGLRPLDPPRRTATPPCLSSGTALSSAPTAQAPPTEVPPPRPRSRPRKLRPHQPGPPPHPGATPKAVRGLSASVAAAGKHGQPQPPATERAIRLP